jgi:hypothetical protein
MLLEIFKAYLPTLSKPAQKLALKIVDVLEPNVTMIELPEKKTREEWALEVITVENILQNTEPVNIAYLSSSSGEADSDSDSDDDDFVEMKCSPTKTELYQVFRTLRQQMECSHSRWNWKREDIQSEEE